MLLECRCHPNVNVPVVRSDCHECAGMKDLGSLNFGARLKVDASDIHAVSAILTAVVLVEHKEFEKLSRAKQVRVIRILYS
jgi:hypothetical protein